MAGSGLGRKSLVLTICSILALIASDARAEKPGVAAKSGDVERGKYNGSGSCAASPCHGEAQPGSQDIRDRTRRGILQNEYFTWRSSDPHFGALTSLQSDRSKKMMEILRRAEGDSPTWKANAAEEPRCRACHTLMPKRSEAMQARRFEDEGISCENCHGASSGWFGNHFRTDWTTKQSIEAGLFPMDDLAQRSNKCLDCHMGTRNQEVDHEMIAAGHPDLFFEVDLFSAQQPPHWLEPPAWTQPKLRKENGPWGEATRDVNFKARLWAVGQAVKLQRALERLAWRSERATQGEGTWPELSELDCFSCHHSVRSNSQPTQDQRRAGLLSDPSNNWRQDPNHNGTVVGSPSWNTSHYIVLRALVDEIDHDDSAALKAKFKDLSLVAGSLSGKAATVHQKAKDFSEFVATLVPKMNRSFSNQTITNLMLRISQEGSGMANRDTRSAEQAYMALDSLFRCFDPKINTAPSNDQLSTGAFPAVGKAINNLYRQFNDPSAFDAQAFATGMREVHVQLVKAVGGTHTSSRGETPAGQKLQSSAKMTQGQSH